MIDEQCHHLPFIILLGYVLGIVKVALNCTYSNVSYYCNCNCFLLPCANIALFYFQGVPLNTLVLMFSIRVQTVNFYER